MPVGRPPDVESIGIGEHRRVAVRRAETGEDPISGGNALPADLDRFLRRARGGEVGRALEAEDLLHRRADDIRAFPQAGILLRVPQEEEHAVAEQTRRRLVAGNEEEHAGGEHLSYRGLPPRIVGRQERRDEIVTGLALAFPDDPREIVGEPPHVPRRHLRPSRHVGAGRQHRQVGFREAEEAHHHSPRDPIGEVLHEVEAGETGNAVDLLVGDRHDP